MDIKWFSQLQNITKLVQNTRIKLRIKIHIFSRFSRETFAKQLIAFSTTRRQFWALFIAILFAVDAELLTFIWSSSDDTICGLGLDIRGGELLPEEPAASRSHSGKNICKFLNEILSPNRMKSNEFSKVYLPITLKSATYYTFANASLILITLSFLVQARWL